MKAFDFSLLQFGPKRAAPRHCTSKTGCKLATREGKDFCPDHIDESPYIQGLMDALNLRREQDELILTQREVTPPPDKKPRGGKKTRSKKTTPKKKFISLEDSMTAREVIAHLAYHGPRTEERLCRELSIDVKVLRAYVKQMKHRNMLTIGQTRRGSTLYKLRLSAGQVATTTAHFQLATEYARKRA